MADVESINQVLQKLREQLDAPELTPDRGRGDWESAREPLRQARATLEGELLEPLDGLLASLETPEDKEALKGAAAQLAGETAAVLHASADIAGAQQVMRRAVEIAPDNDVLREGLDRMDLFTQLSFCMDLMSRGEREAAKEQAQALLQQQPGPAIRAVAQGIADAPKPLAKAPSLGTLNGIGFNVHGRRDAAEDGTYVTTRYFTFIFLPLFPIDAYRVADAEGGGYYFLAKAALSNAARWWQRLVLGGAVAAVLAMAGYAWWSSPDRRLGVALEEARAEEADAASAEQRAAAVAGYERVVQEFAGEVEPGELAGAAASVVRLLAADVDEEFAADDVDHALRIVRRVEEMPAAVRSPEADGELSRRLAGWADALGGADEASLRGAVRLLDEAARFSPGAELVAKTNAARRSLADALAADWPLEAVGMYLDLGDQEGAHAAAGATLESLDPRSSAWSQLAEDVERWAADAGDAPLAATLRQRVAAARERDASEERAALLEDGDERRLRRALAADPADQGVAVALAYALRGEGRGGEALALLEGLGKPGVLVREAQTARATLLGDEGRLEEARDLLERNFESRLPGYEAVQRSYVARAEELQTRLVERAQRGDLPPDLVAQLEGRSDEEQQQLFGDWLSRQLDEDPQLQELRAAYEGYGDVVPTALTLGSVTLRLAAEAEGEEKSRLLEGAERAFLSIQGDAEGLPTYHLGLGQVYHRLGKTEEGEREFATLLGQEDDWLALQVAMAYRELGMVARAREVNVEVTERGDGEAREQAAISLAVMADTLDEQERWYREANSDTPFVKYSLLKIEADRLSKQGDCAAADEKYAEVVAWEVQGAEARPAAANNAGLTLVRRYDCTGDVAHLDRAVALMEGGLRLEPDNALLVGNLADVVAQRGYLRVLETWLDPWVLRLDGGDAATVIGNMLDGPEREGVLEALRRSTDLRRGLDLARQQEVLAPSSPDGYARELGWYRWQEDLDRLRDLLTRVERAEGIDSSSAANQSRRWQSGERDKEFRGDWRGQLAALRDRRAALPAAASPATRAVSFLLESGVLRLLALVDDAPEHAAASVEALEQARATWPGIGAGRSLAGALLNQAILEAGAGEPVVARAWEEDSRRVGPSVQLAGLMEKPEAVAALRGRPEIARAAEVLRPASARRPEVLDFFIGRLVEDEGLEASGRAAFSSELERVEAELELLLDGEESSETYLALLQKGP